MGIYIPGIEMPHEGQVIVIDSTGGVWSNELPNRGYTHINGAKAVAIPAHGRLVDADVFSAEMKERQYAAMEWKEEAKDSETAARADAVLGFLSEVKLTLDKLPTVIPEDET